MNLRVPQSFLLTTKSLQSCPTLCDPIDGRPPGSPVPGILQARTLVWAAISFSNAWKWKVKVKSLSYVQPSVDQPSRLLRPRDFPGKSTGVGCHCLLRFWVKNTTNFNLLVSAIVCPLTKLMNFTRWRFSSTEAETYIKVYCNSIHDSIWKKSGDKIQWSYSQQCVWIHEHFSSVCCLS